MYIAKFVDAVLTHIALWMCVLALDVQCSLLTLLFGCVQMICEPAKPWIDISLGVAVSDFTLEVLGGKNFTLSNDTVKDGPIIFHVYDPKDGYSSWMWRSDDSVQDFLTRTPSRTRYLFFSYGGTLSL